MTPGKAADFTLVSIDAMGGTGRDGENNMNIENAEIYLKKNGKKLLTGGKSRARVYDIGGAYVLKQIYRAELGDDALYEA